MIAYRDIPDIRTFFDATPSDRRVGRAFYSSEMRDLARVVGVQLPRSYVSDAGISARIREMLQEDIVTPPTCSCKVGEGRRWHLADVGRSVTYGLDPSLKYILPKAFDYAQESFTFVDKYGKQLNLVPVKHGEVPNIYVTADAYDGPGRTLGATIYFERPTGDLHIEGYGKPTVTVVMDTAEDWSDVNYFRTVLRHELFHAVGLDHAERVDDIPPHEDIMHWSYTGIKLGHPGVWTAQQMTQRYYSEAA